MSRKNDRPQPKPDRVDREVAVTLERLRSAESFCDELGFTGHLRQEMIADLMRDGDDD